MMGFANTNHSTAHVGSFLSFTNSFIAIFHMSKLGDHILWVVLGGIIIALVLFSSSSGLPSILGSASKGVGGGFILDLQAGSRSEWTLARQMVIRLAMGSMRNTANQTGILLVQGLKLIWSSGDFRRTRGSSSRWFLRICGDPSRTKTRSGDNTVDHDVEGLELFREL